VNKATHRAWAQEYGVICLSGSSTFFTIDGADQPQFWPPDSLRQALKPSGAPLHLLHYSSSASPDICWLLHLLLYCTLRLKRSQNNFMEACGVI
jgi:hypothetical protein